MLQRYDNCAVDAVRHLVAGDIAYSVLYKILGGVCSCTYTDGESVIICHSTMPYPVWVWCRDPKDPEMARQVGEILKSAFPPRDTYNVILPATLLAEMGKRDPYFVGVPVKMELYSYMLSRLNPAPKQVEGEMEVAREEDITLLSVLWQEMSYEMEGFRLTMETCRQRMETELATGNFYVWRKGGEIVATAKVEYDGDYGRVGAVYTIPHHRRRGYAIHLVHDLTAKILEAGKTPILYTDGGYAASNTCYQKLGYQEVGRLVNIGKCQE